MILPGWEPYDQQPAEPISDIFCDCCGEGIYEGQSYLLTPDGARYCAACAEDMMTMA